MTVLEKKEVLRQPVRSKKVNSSRTKIADPQKASRDAATQAMIKRAQDLGIDTIFDRAVQMKPRNTGAQGTSKAIGRSSLS